MTQPAWMSAPIDGAQQEQPKQPAWMSAPMDDSAPAVPLGRGATDTGRNLVAGALRGAGSIGATILWPVDKLHDIIAGDRGPNLSGLVTGKQPISRNEERRQAMTEALQMLGADPESTAFKVGKVGGEIAGTAGVGGAAVAGLRAVAPAVTASRLAAPVLSAIETGGVSSGGTRGLAGLGARTVGGAAVGGGAAAMAGGNKEDAQQAAFMGAVLPMGLGVAGKTVAAATGMVKPWMGKGQDEIVGAILRQYANDPKAAIAALQNLREVVPGSAPITAAAAGDVGLSGLTRTMQANPQVANELAVRATAQNAARTNAMEAVAGNRGRIDAAKQARDQATEALREQVLSQARPIDAGQVIAGLEDMMRDPNNAGATARGALERVRKQVADFAGDGGAIDARALYEIRKDVGLAMQGKLQGEAGNLRYARGVLDNVQQMFDSAIGSAVRPLPAAAPTMSAGRDVVVHSGSAPLARPGVAGPAAQVAEDATPDMWRQYLQTYTEKSRPINQMEKLQDVLQAAQTGTTDMQGNLILSPAKLNNLLKNQGDELQRLLTPAQMQILRNVAADANAARLGLESGKAVGSNTVQNLSQTWLLNRVLGQYGESPLVSSLMKKPLGLLYGSANEQITDKLSQALLDPRMAARLMAGTQQAPGAVPLSSLLRLGAPAQGGSLPTR